MRLFMILGWAWACLGKVNSEVIISKLGEDVVLKPTGDVSKPITSIAWKYGPNFAVQYDGTDEIFYRHFKERGSLNKKTGELTIRNVALTDANLYTPEINNLVQEKIDLKVYRPVPKPKITYDQETYRFSCTGDTTDVEAVTYSWSLDNKTLSDSQEVTFEECASYTCTMRNPVSEMQSDPHQCASPVAVVLPIVLGILVLVVVVVVAVVAFHKIKTKQWFCQKGAKFWRADFWKDTTGQAVKGSDVSGENTPMA